MPSPRKMKKIRKQQARRGKVSPLDPGKQIKKNEAAARKATGGKKTKVDKAPPKKKSSPKKKSAKAKVPPTGRTISAITRLGAVTRAGLYGAAALGGVGLLSASFSMATRGRKTKQASKKLLASQKRLTEAVKKKYAGWGVLGADTKKLKSKKPESFIALSDIHGGTIKDKPLVPYGVEEEEREKAKRANIVVPKKSKKKLAKKVVPKKKKALVKSTTKPKPISKPVDRISAQDLYTKISSTGTTKKVTKPVHHPYDVIATSGRGVGVEEFVPEREAMARYRAKPLTTRQYEGKTYPRTEDGIPYNVYKSKGGRGPTVAKENKLGRNIDNFLRGLVSIFPGINPKQATDTLAKRDKRKHY